MNKVNFFDGMEPVPADFNDTETYFEERINRNQAALTDKGVVVNADLSNGITLNPPYLSTDNSSLSVYGFLAYDNSGRMLYLAPSFSEGVKVPSIQNLKPINDETLTLNNRQLVNTGDTVNFGANISYYVVARYSEVYTGDLSTQHNTGVQIQSRIRPSVSFFIRELESIIEGDVILGQITTNERGILSVTETARDTLTVRGDLITSDVTYEDETNTVSFSDHIKMLGTGTYSSSNPHATSASDLGIDPTATGNHQLYEHSNGIQSDNPSSTSSALAFQLSSGSLEGTTNISVQPLSSVYNEVLGMSNTMIYPSRFSGILTTTIDQEAGQGYYILVLNTSANIELFGPFSSETASDFKDTLTNRSLFPICSFYWGIPKVYSILLGGTLSDSTTVSNWRVASTDQLLKYDGTYVSASEVEIGDRIFYSQSTLYLTVNSKEIPYGSDFLTTKILDQSTVTDRRQFNNTSFKDINLSDLASIRDSAPFSEESSKCYNARIVSSNESSVFSLSNKIFQVEFDGVLCSSYLTFPDTSYYTLDSVIYTLNNWISAAYQGPHTSDGLIPKAMINHAGKLTIVAADSIIVSDLGDDQADSELGFKAGADNSSDVDNYLKLVVTDGDIYSTQEIYYDGQNRVQNIYYSLPGGTLKHSNIEYSSAGNVIKYTGE